MSNPYWHGPELAPGIIERGCGIYMFEIEGGERYVGQTHDLQSRGMDYVVNVRDYLAGKP